MSKLITFLILSLMATACGKAPDLSDIAVGADTAPPVVTPLQALPEPELKEYAHTEKVQFCDAIKVWVPSTTSLKYTTGPVGNPGTSSWLFTRDGISQIYQGNATLITYTTPVQIGSVPFTCVIQLTLGQLTGVQ